MVFSSLIFLFFFLPAVLFCYYIVPTRFIRARNMVLLLFSLFFYFYGEPKLIIMLVLSILMNYLFGLSMRSRYRKSLLIFCITANLTLLGVFKYLNFFIRTADGLLGLNIQLTSIVMPIGISFYTFQALSYVIDVYRREVPPQHDPFSLALYVSMFPQLIAGPIVRYHDVNEQLAVRSHSVAQFSDGISRFVFGLSKKVLLSNVFAQIADGIFAYQPAELSTAAAWLGAIGYTLQIYFDFSGYSDMAIGLGRMLGFEFPKNFDRPYASGSVTEFWRRWHISLGTWFREYVYIPLGGNRKGVKRQIINLLIVWALTGLWHGASWNFVIWGLYYGILLIFEKFVYVHMQKRLPKFLNVVITFIVVIIGWVFFFSNNMTEAVSYLKAMFGQSGCSHDGMGGFLLLNNLVMIILAWIPSVFDFKEGKKKSPLKWVLCIMVFLITIAFLVSESYNPFLYFRF